MDYRRSISADRLNDLWHFDWNCRFYPNKGYLITHDKPSADDLCTICQSPADDDGLG